MKKLLFIPILLCFGLIGCCKDGDSKVSEKRVDNKYCINECVDSKLYKIRDRLDSSSTFSNVVQYCKDFHSVNNCCQSNGSFYYRECTN